MAKSNQSKKRWPDRAIDYFAKRNSKFWGSLFVPFIVGFKHKVDFFLWGMFVIVAGQLGTIINVVNRTLFQNPDWSFPQALYPDSVFGSFYTYALVLIASKYLLVKLYAVFVKLFALVNNVSPLIS